MEQVSYVRQNKIRPQMAYTQQTRPQTSYGQQKSSACWKCGNTFSMAHLQICPAKQMQCKICKKLGHYTSLCTAKMPERRPPRGPTNNTSPQFKQQQTRRVKHIKQGLEESDHTEESVDAEAALYIKRTPWRLGEYHHNTTNGIRTKEKWWNQQRPIRRILGRNNYIPKQSTVASRYRLTTVIHEHRHSNKTPKGDPDSKNIRIYRKHSLQKFYKQQFRNKRNTLTLSKFRIMDS